MKVKKFLLLSIVLIFILSSLPCNYSFSATEDDLTIYAPSVILMDEDSGKILYEKDANEKKFPASTTKLMTAILTVENCSIDDIARVSYNAVFSIPSGYSNAALQVDEELTINDLLHALLIPSANDAANVLAEHIAGSIQSFCSMMNTKAAEIGCTNTNFVNPSGIHNENHYSTAYDLCLIAKYASKYEIIRQIATETSYILPATNKYPKEDRNLTTTNYLLKNNYPKYYYEYANGLKTGYTTEAKDCIIATATKDSKNLICVVLGANRNENGISEKYLDCKELFDFGFENFSKITLINKGDIVDTTKIKGASLDTRILELESEDNISILINNSDIYKQYNPKINLKQELQAPISKGEIVGTVNYEIDNIIYSTNLIAGNNIEKSSLIQIIFRVMLILLILFILYFTLNAIRNKSNKNDRRNRKKYKKIKYISRYK